MGWENIIGATSKDYTFSPDPGDVGTLYRCIATNTEGTDTSDEAELLEAIPANTVAPVVNGTTTVGSVLTCTEGTWTGTPTFTYQWYADDVLIVGEIASTYTIPIDDVGAMLECRVTGTNAAGSDVAISNEVGPVTNPPSGVGVMVIGSDFTVS